ncbi:F-box/LRR-repeat protein 25-like [Pyrus communis]|uniref:F-box/LRR-repeat protein 25-like n=1 Tax=Pyrus communis TaxID=23211 RepID=UPI0035BEBF1A
MEGSNEITNTRNLNDLPEDLLLHILTFLPTLNSVQTSLISHKRLPLWSRVPSLNFNFQLFPPYEPPLDTRQLYADFVNRVLISRSDSPIHTFRLSLIYHNHYRYHVDSWVRSAVTHFRARELYFDFFINQNFHNAEEAETEDHHMYDFPFSVLRNGCVEKMSLARCYLNLPANLPTMRFGSIGSMVLDDVYLTDQMVEDLILGCPNLEAFEILGCCGPIHLKICSKRLKRLRIVLGYYFPDDPEKRQTLLVDCPNICSIVPLRSLLLRMFLTWLSFVPISCTESISLIISGVSSLLFYFIVVIMPKYVSNVESLSGELLDKPVEFKMPCLKQVAMEAYTGSEDDDKFMKILMRHEGALEKIVVVPFQGFENGEKKSLPPVVYRRRVSQVGSTASSAAPNGI